MMLGLALALPAVRRSGSNPNLFAFPSQFEQSPTWTPIGSRVAAAPDTITAPDGTLTADTLSTVSTVNNSYYLPQGVSLTPGTYTVSIHVKYKTGSGLVWLIGETGSNTFCYFNIQTGVVTQSTGFVSASVESRGNGWFRIIATFTKTSAAATEEVGLGFTNATGTVSFAPASVGAHEVYIWGAKLERSATVSAYP